MRQFLTALGLVVAAAPGLAANERNTVYFSDATGVPLLLDTSTTPAFGSLTATGPYSTSTHSGQAFAPTQTLRASVNLSASQSGSTPTNSWLSASAKTESSFYKEVLIGAGSSGLSPGTVVPLALTVNLHGIVSTGGSGATDLQRVLSSLDSSLDYRVHDLDDQVCDEGCRPRELATFGYGSRVVYDYNFGGDGLVDLGTRHGWSTLGTLSPYAEFLGPNYYIDNQPYVSSFGYVLSTGMLQINFESAVGHTLRATATMDSFAQALGVGGVGWSLGDFSSTFDAELSSPVAGLLLVGETPGVLAAVPEPGSWALMLAGLAALGGLARRSARRGI